MNYICPADAPAAIAAIEAMIAAATTPILVFAYEYTHPGIHTALLQARSRSVPVTILADSSIYARQVRDRTFVDALRSAGATVNIVSASGPRPGQIMHAKTIVIADQVWTGSLNFSNSGPYEVNVCSLTTDHDLATRLRALAASLAR
jgi:phosphatidylserine/phosphatidylglycerophosphate/cardiolipin synthase-like enzyme